ncbi:MAG: TonB-dependent receptor domain-containing protein, partial [Gemmatimonadales bacterium]
KATSLRLLGMATQRQARLFEYDLLYNPQALPANRTWSRLAGIQFIHEIDAAGRMQLEAALSWQSDRLIEGPLTVEGELNTRKPAGGFLVGSFDFRHDFESFPIDDELLENYLLNTPGSRRSPYDLENSSQYGLIDEYRNNAYGLFGFVEGGGPVGRITLARENRLVGQASLAWQPLRRHNLRIGAEFTRYDIDYYSHLLASQGGSDIWLEQPVYAAFYVEDRFAAGPFTVIAGLRYDRFDSRASRPEFPRISSAPGFDPANPTAAFVNDESHSVLGPRVRLSYALNDATTFRLGYARQSAVPDFGLLFRGINTDRAISMSDDLFATDLKLSGADMAEVGLKYDISGGLSVDFSVWNRHSFDLPVGRVVSSFDPAIGANTDLFRIVSQGESTVRGLDIRLDGHPWEWLGVGIGYSLQHSHDPAGFRLAESRPHTVAGTIALSAPGSLNGTLGNIIRGATLHTLFRFSSGTAYTGCAPGFGDPLLLSNSFCSGLFSGEINGRRVPAIRQLDMRLAKRFEVGGRRLAMYLDFRNILDFRNVLQVFSLTGTTENDAGRNQVWASDSAGLANEASTNGLYDFASGDIDLRFGGVAASGCGSWANTTGNLSVPNCVYLVRAEARFGDGNHVFNLAEQRRASQALFDARYGEQLLTGPGRRLRLGVEVGI